MYADDTQLYITFDPDHEDGEHQARSKLQTCISDIKTWMTLNRLKLNDAKTELLIISSKNNQAKIKDKSLIVGDSRIATSPSARNLGIIFDQTMKMESQVKSTCKSVYFQIRNISSIRRYLSDSAANTVVNALIMSRLDYGNFLTYGINSQLLHKLQLVQNATARMLTHTSIEESALASST